MKRFACFALLTAVGLLLLFCCTACSPDSGSLSTAKPTDFQTSPQPRDSSAALETTGTEPPAPSGTTADPMPDSPESLNAWIDARNQRDQNRLVRTHTVVCGDSVFLFSDRYSLGTSPAERTPYDGGCPGKQIEQFRLATGELTDLGWHRIQSCSLYDPGDGTFALAGLTSEGFPSQWILTLHADGTVSERTVPYLLPVETSFTDSGGVSADVQTRLLDQHLTFNGLELLLDYAEDSQRGIGMGIPGGPFGCTFDAASRELTLLLPMTLPPDAAAPLGENRFIAAARIEPHGETGSAIRLQLTPLARFYKAGFSLLLPAPEYFSFGQPYQIAFQLTFSAGRTDVTNPDPSAWQAPNELDLQTLRPIF